MDHSTLVETLPAMALELEAESQIPAHEKIDVKDYLPITDSKNIERYISDYFADIPILVKIAKCESRFRHYNSRGEVLRGEKNTYDRGVMQINLLYHEKDATKMGLDLHKLEDNVAYARYLYGKQGSKPWNSSSACWSRTSSQSEIAKK